MLVNISYLEVPLYLTDKPLREVMHLTGAYNPEYKHSEEEHPKYKNINIEWNKLHSIINSNYRQYGPYLYVDGIKRKSSWNNDLQNLLIFDIDDGMSIDEARKLFNKYTYLIATTKSHQQEKKGTVCDRYRIVFPAINIPRDKDIYFKMLEQFASFVPCDKQASKSGGGFLGYFGCSHYYNEGIMFDCSLLAEQAKQMSVNEKKEKIKREMERKLSPDVDYALDVQDIKQELNMEIMTDIIDSLGYEVVGNKFRLREDERTPSATIYKDGGIYDFGSGGISIFDLVMMKKAIDFRESLQYVSKFIKE